MDARRRRLDKRAGTNGTHGDAGGTPPRGRGLADVPPHDDAWAHLTESLREIDTAFRAHALGHRLHWLAPAIASASARAA